MLYNQHRVLLMWIPWNERFLPNTNGQWDFLSKDFLHIMYILTSGDVTFIQILVCIPGISYNFDLTDLMEC